MKKLFLSVFLVLSFVLSAESANGLIDVKSSFDVKKTADRMESLLKAKGMTVFNRIKHSESANNIGIDLRDTELLIFGNPKVGSPLMMSQQSIAIDLPQKVLIWKDDKGQVWLSYNDPRFLEKRHGVEGGEKIIAKIEKVLAGLVKGAASE